MLTLFDFVWLVGLISFADVYFRFIALLLLSFWVTAWWPCKHARCLLCSFSWELLRHRACCWFWWATGFSPCFRFFPLSKLSFWDYLSCLASLSGFVYSHFWFRFFTSLLRFATIVSSFLNPRALGPYWPWLFFCRCMPDLVVMCLLLILIYSVAKLAFWHRSFWDDNVFLIFLCLFSNFYGFVLCLLSLVLHFWTFAQAFCEGF